MFHKVRQCNNKKHQQHVLTVFSPCLNNPSVSGVWVIYNLSTDSVRAGHFECFTLTYENFVRTSVIHDTLRWNTKQCPYL